VTEPMGNEVFLYLVSGEHTFIARVDPRTRARMGDRLEVSFDMSQIHIFDRDTQVAIR
jgi:multiple sugar transport system ATP-binding protein